MEIRFEAHLALILLFNSAWHLNAAFFYHLCKTVYSIPCDVLMLIQFFCLVKKYDPKLFFGFCNILAKLKKTS